MLVEFIERAKGTQATEATRIGKDEPRSSSPGLRPRGNDPFRVHMRGIKALEAQVTGHTQLHAKRALRPIGRTRADSDLLAAALHGQDRRADEQISITDAHRAMRIALS